MRWRDIGFILPFGLALLPLAATASIAAGVSANLGAWLPIIFIFVVLPAIDFLCGTDTSNVDSTDVERVDHHVYFRALCLLALPAWLTVLVYCSFEFQHLPLDAIGMIGWVASTGILGGILAINPGHELIHKSGRFERACGGFLLSSVGYHGFKIEHVRGHHVHVATPRDSSSAALGESVFAFVPRALFHNVRNAWRLEALRLQLSGRSPWSPGNELLRWSLLWLALLVAFATLFGTRGTVFFMATGLAASASLEVINYIEHYGLTRALVARAATNA